MKKIILVALALFAFLVCADSAVARSISLGTKNIFWGSDRTIQYFNGTSSYVVAYNALYLSYIGGKFVWLDTTTSTFKYVTAANVTTIKNYEPYINIPTSYAYGLSQLVFSNAQMTPYGFLTMGGTNLVQLWATTGGTSTDITLPYSAGGSSFIINNYKLGKNGHIYLAFRNNAITYGSDRAGFLCEFTSRPFALVNCWTTGVNGSFDFMGMVDENHDSVYDGTLYIEKSSSGYAYYANNTLVYSGTNVHLGRAEHMDIWGLDDVRFYTPNDPESASGGITYIGEYSLNAITGVVTYKGRFDTDVTATYPPWIGDRNQYWYYDNQYVDLFKDTAVSDPFADVGGGSPWTAWGGGGSSSGGFTGSLSFETEEQVCVPVVFSGTTTTSYVLSGGSAVDFSHSSVNGFFNNSWSTTADLSYGTGAELDPWFVTPHASLSVGSSAPLVNELGILGAGTFKAGDKTIISYFSGTGAFDPHGITIDNTALTSPACGELDVRYSYYRPDRQKVAGSFSLPFNGSYEQAFPMIGSGFTLSISSPSGAVCIDKLSVMGVGGLSAVTSYSGDITKYECHSKNYSCEWRTVDSCASSDTCHVDGDYCRVNNDLLETTSSGSYSFGYDSSSVSTYETLDPSEVGNGTGGFSSSYSSLTGSYTAILPGASSGSCAMFDTGSIIPSFHYKYSNVLSFGFDLRSVSDNPLISTLAGFLQKTVDVILSPLNNALSLVLATAPIPDNTQVCYFGTKYTVKYQSVLSAGTGSVNSAIAPYLPVKGKMSFLDYIVLGITSLLLVPLLMLKPFNFSS